MMRRLRTVLPFAPRRLRLAGLLGLLALVVGLNAALLSVSERLPGGLTLGLSVGLTTLAILAFAVITLNDVESREGQERRRTQHLDALNQASLALTSELSLGAVLQKVVDVARRLVGARYGALGVVGPDGRIKDFYISGMGEEVVRRIGHLPEGRGLLGAIVRGDGPLRLRDLTADARFLGFPPHHPSMRSFLGMPLLYKGRSLGNLYLTEREGAAEFSEEDERLLIAMSAHAAVAIENARLYEQVEHVAALEERERIGMDLHDGVIQSLYAVGLNLEECVDSAGEDPAAVQERLNRAIEELNHTIGDIRSYIFDLRPPAEQTDFVEELAHLVKRFKVNTLLDAQLEVHGDVGRLPRGAADNLYHIVQEALNNVAKHSRASRALARVSLENSSLEISVSDNGVGFAPGSPLGGNHQGLRNMRERAGAIGATLTVHSARGRGTTVTVQLPLNGQEV